MGVVYKLQQNVIDFIVSQKQANPALSCRKLVAIVGQQFSIKISKSSVNAVIQDAGLSSAVGRPAKRAKKDQKFKIPEQRKAGLFPEAPQSVQEEQQPVPDTSLPVEDESQSKILSEQPKEPIKEEVPELQEPPKPEAEPAEQTAPPASELQESAEEPEAQEERPHLLPDLIAQQTVPTEPEQEPPQPVPPPPEPAQEIQDAVEEAPPAEPEKEISRPVSKPPEPPEPAQEIQDAVEEAPPAELEKEISQPVSKPPEPPAPVAGAPAASDEVPPAPEKPSEEEELLDDPFAEEEARQAAEPLVVLPTPDMEVIPQEPPPEVSEPQPPIEKKPHKEKEEKESEPLPPEPAPAPSQLEEIPEQPKPAPEPPAPPAEEPVGTVEEQVIQQSEPAQEPPAEKPAEEQALPEPHQPVTELPEVQKTQLPDEKKEPQPAPEPAQPVAEEPLLPEPPAKPATPAPALETTREHTPPEPPAPKPPEPIPAPELPEPTLAPEPAPAQEPTLASKPTMPSLTDKVWTPDAQVLSEPATPAQNAAETGALYDGMGCFFLKAAEWSLSNSSILGGLLQKHVNAYASGDINAVSETLLYYKAFGIDTIEDLAAYHNEGLWKVNGMVAPLAFQSLRKLVDSLRDLPSLALQMTNAYAQIFSEISYVKLTLADGTAICIDAQMQSLWLESNVHSIFPIPLNKILSYISQQFISNVQPVIIASIPGYKMFAKQFYELVWACETNINKNIIKVSIHDEQREEIARFTTIPAKKRTFIIGAWPWQGECKKWIEDDIRLINHFYHDILGKEVYFSEIKATIESDTIGQNIKVRVALIRETGLGWPVMAIVTNATSQQMPIEEVITAYLARWPNLQEGNKDFNAKVEKGSYGAFSIAPAHDRVAYLDGSGTYNLLAGTPDVDTIVQFLMASLHNYCQRHFFPPQYETVNWEATRERFYRLDGFVFEDNKRIIVSLVTPDGYAFTQDLQYAIRRFNESDIRDYAGNRIVLRIAHSAPPEPHS